MDVIHKASYANEMVIFSTEEQFGGLLCISSSFLLLFLEKGCGCEIFVRSLVVFAFFFRFLVTFNLGVQGCNGWFTIGVYMFLVSISFDFGL